MFLNNFSVRIIGANEVPGGYVEIPHNTKYKIALSNRRNVPCDAAVKIDGKSVGVWRIEAFSHIVLERPAHDDGKFTFYAAGTLKAEKAGLASDSPNLGLVEVTFIPMKVQTYTYTTHYTPDGWVYHYGLGSSAKPAEKGIYEGSTTVGATAAFASGPMASGPMASGPMASSQPVSRTASPGRKSGGTGLSGKSNQNFGVADQMLLDYAQTTIINLRLVTPRREDYDEPRPLTQYSTPVPPRVDW